MNRNPKTEKLIAVKIPKDLLEHLDDAVRKEDSDRSKFVRNAVRERLRKTLGRPIPTATR